MKIMRTNRIFLFISAALLILGCEENFDPKIELQNTFVMTAIISSSNNPLFTTSSRMIRLTRLYDLDGFDPSLNSADPAVKGAVIDFIHNNRKYETTEETIRRIDTSRYQNDETVYKTPPIDIRTNDLIKINCQAPDGTMLTGETRIPRSQTFEYSYPFNRGITTNINTFIWGDSWLISWRRSEGVLYFPKLNLIYEVKTSDSTSTTKTAEVPTGYTVSNGERIAVYPEYSTAGSIEYTFEAIDSTMSQISAGDSDKSKYFIIGFVFEFVEFDRNLASYYSSTKGFLDQYSIRLDESIYSNVSGGIGIVGSYMDSRINHDVDRAYAASFGYRSN